MPGVVLGGLFAIALTIFVDALLYKTDSVSFYSLARANSLVPAEVFMAGALLGIVYEFVGSIALGQWYYPTIRHRRRLFLVLPFFWALFMIIMQDTFAICRAVGLTNLAAFVITSIVPLLLIEGINIYTRSWVYQRVLRSIPMLVAGWFLMTYMFVWLFNAHVVNPFGF